MNRAGLLRRLAALLVAPAVAKMPAPAPAVQAAAPMAVQNQAPFIGGWWANSAAMNATTHYACGQTGCTIRYLHGHIYDSMFGKRPPDEDGALVA